MREKCDEAGLAGIPLLVGGNIVVGKQDFADVEKRFKAMGFDRAFPPGTPPETTIAALREILLRRGGAMKPVLLTDFGSTYTKLTAVDLDAAEFSAQHSRIRRSPRRAHRLSEGTGCAAGANQGR